MISSKSNDNENKIVNNIKYRMAGVVLMRFAATAVVMIAMAEIYVGLKV